MGEGSSVGEKTLSPLEYLDALFEYALALGMSYEEYWDKEPELLLRYVKAEKLKMQKKNTEMWLQGAYIYHAVGALYPAFNPFSKEHKTKPYLSAPVPLTEEEKAKQFEAKVEKFMDSLVGLKPRGEEG